MKFEINNTELEIKYKWIGERKGFPFDEKDGYEHNIFDIIISRNIDGKKVSRHFKFYDNYQNYIDGKVTLSDDDLLDGFRCIIDDCILGTYSFEDFCMETGLINDSIKANKIYNECKKSLKKLHDLGITNDDLYIISNKLSDMEA